MRTSSGLLIGLIAFSLIVNNAKAQVSLTSISPSKTKAITALTDGSDGKALPDEKTPFSKDNLKNTKANFRAIESFKKEFKDVPEANWIIETDVIKAFFERNGVQTKVIYDKNGNWVHTIAYCNESKMPKDIKC